MRTELPKSDIFTIMRTAKTVRFLFLRNKNQAELKPKVYNYINKRGEVKAMRIWQKNIEDIIYEIDSCIKNGDD